MRLAEDLRREHPGIEVHLTGDVMSDNAFGEASRNDMATLIPLTLITLVVVVGFSLRAVTGTLSTLTVFLISVLTGMGLAGWLSLIPNLAPAFMAFGVGGLVVGRAGLGLAISAAMTIGIVVDDTVHFLSKYSRARREHERDPAEAVRYSFRTVGMAMWITTAALGSGFMVLSLSGYRMNSEMGLMAAMTIAFAFALDVPLLPALLMKADARFEEVPDTDAGLVAAPAPLHE